MAQGNVNQISPTVAARIDEVKSAYAQIRRLMDRLIVIRGVNDYTAVAAALGCVPGDGQTAFDNLDAALGGLTTANNALSNMDKNAL
jgi:hypothetical protein